MCLIPQRLDCYDDSAKHQLLISVFIAKQISFNTFVL